MVMNNPSSVVLLELILDHLTCFSWISCVRDQDVQLLLKQEALKVFCDCLCAAGEGGG